MDEQAVQTRAQATCDALLAGDIGRAAEEMSKELRTNLGQVVAMLPMPMTQATVESVEQGPKSYLAVLRLVGESGTVRLQTRWKERDGRPTIVEASHIPEVSVQVEPEGELQEDAESTRTAP